MYVWPIAAVATPNSFKCHFWCEKNFHLEIFPSFPLKHALSRGRKNWERIFSKNWQLENIVETYFCALYRHIDVDEDTCGTILRCTEVIHTEWICFYFLFFSPFERISLPEWMNENFLPFMLPLLLPFTLYTHWERKFIYFMLAYISIKEKTNFHSLLYFPFINVTIIVYLRLFIMMMHIHTYAFCT